MTLPFGTPRNHAEEIGNARHQMQHADRRAELRLDIALTLEILPGAARAPAIREAILIHGGSFVPRNGKGWGPHQCELSLLGIAAFGDDLDACAAQWCRAVIRSARAEGLPC